MQIIKVCTRLCALSFTRLEGAAIIKQKTADPSHSLHRFSVFKLNFIGWLILQNIKVHLKALFHSLPFIIYRHLYHRCYPWVPELRGQKEHSPLLPYWKGGKGGKNGLFVKWFLQNARPGSIFKYIPAIKVA